MPTYSVQAPNGQTYSIDGPAGATDQQVQAQILAQHPEAAKPAPKPTLVQNITGVMANFNRGLGVGDEIAAAGNTAGNLFRGKIGLTDIPSDLSANMAIQRQAEARLSAAHPLIAAGARGTGMAATAAIPAADTANVFAQGGRLGLNIPTALNAARGATTAGLTGAVYAAADAGTPAERLKAASAAATNPVNLGLGAVLGAASTPMAMNGPKSPSMDLDQLTAAKNAAYKAVDDSGVKYTPQAFGGLTQDMAKAMDAEGFNAGLHPKAAAMMERIGQSDRASGGFSPTLTQLDQLRQQIGRDVVSAGDPGEARMGQIMRGKIDEFVAKADPAALTGGNAAQAADLISSARDLNTRVRKVQAVNEAMDTAALNAGSTGSGGNIDNATRQQLKRVLVNTPNLTDEETSALTKIVMGGHGQNLLRQVGKLSPQGNGIMAAGNLAAAGFGGPLGAIPGATGLLSKLAADGITRSRVAGLVDLMSRGGTAAPTRIVGSALPASAAATLARGAGVATAAPGQVRNVFAQPANP